MILNKLTRERIYAAAGKPLEIQWPEDAPNPKRGRSYTVQSSNKNRGESRIVVVRCRELSAGAWKAEVKLDADPVRLLGKSSGYVSSPAGAMNTKARTEDDSIEVEPEAVDAAYQERISQEGRMKTALHGAEQRQRHRAMRSEVEAAEQRKRGKSGTLAQAAAERQKKHLR